MVLPRLLLVAAALALPATASASVTKVTTPADDYLLGQTTPVTVKLKAAPKQGKVKVFVDDAQQGRAVAAAGKRAVQVTAAFGKTGEVTVKGCLGGSCKTKKVRVHAPAPTPTSTPGPQTYKLQLTAGSVTSRTDASRTPNADTYCGHYGFELHSVKTIDGQLSEADDANALTIGTDGAVAGNARGTAASTFDWPALTGCEDGPNGGVVRCDTTHHDTGSSAIGFSVASIPGDSAHVALTWTLPLPDGGFVDYGEDVCNVSEIAQYPKDDKQVTTVALADLISGRPLTLTNAGSDSYAADFTGKPAIIATTWSQTVTVQAVKQ